MRAHRLKPGSIAIVGMAGRFPGANSIGDFWDNLCAGRNALRRYTREEVRESMLECDPASLPYVRKDIADDSWVAAGYFLEDVDKFDATFFGYNPAEAELLDPQQRLFLETAWAALEDAGYIPDECPGTVGIYAGTSLSRYFYNNIYPNRELMRAPSKDLIAGIGNEPDYLTNRAAYKLNLTGPSITLQTACSTSLVAIHVACRALRSGECDMALAGGSQVLVPGGLGYKYQEGGMVSPDGLLRTFDSQAAGTVFSEGGVGIIVLKRLEDAIDDHNQIYSVILGSAVTNDGSFKAGYTAPGIDGQMHVIERALADAGVNPDDIGYVEAHGTSTSLGDPIEIAALTRAWRKHTNRTRYCALGSLKTNIGHQAPVAGVASVIKTALTIRHGLIPPTLHFKTPNPLIDFTSSPFTVNTQLRPWRQSGPRLAAVSSFGIGGTNAHVIMEEFPQTEPTLSGDKPRMFPLSAKSSKTLSRVADNLHAFLDQHPELDLDDIAFTLQEGRKAMEVRATIAVADRELLLRELTSLRDNPPKAKALSAQGRKIFLFTGQGSQYVGMGKGLYENLPLFREIFDECCEKLTTLIGTDLRTLVFAPETSDEAVTGQLKQTRIAQPLLFAFEYALVKQMEAFGIEPDAMIGHSLGEYVAACLASVFSLEDALRLVVRRGALMQSMPSGSMLSVTLDEAALEPYIDENISLAAVNSPSVCVLSGTHDAIAHARERLESAGVACRPLATSHAFHSAMMKPIVREFVAAVRSADPKPPRRRYVSNVTGDWISADDACNPDYWARHLLGCVRFGQGMNSLLSDSGAYFIEIGPGNVLSTFARHAINAAKSSAAVIQTVRHPKEDIPDEVFLRQTLGNLWASGVNLDWGLVDEDNHGRRISLPTYPFNRERHWLEPPKLAETALGATASRRPDLAQWFYAPSWRRLPALAGCAADWSGERILILAESVDLGAELAAAFEVSGALAIQVMPGEGFHKHDANTFSVRLGAVEDFEKLAKEIGAASPTAIIHALCASRRSEMSLAVEEHWLERSFYSLLFLVQQFSSADGDRHLPLLTVSTELNDILSSDSLNPLKAALSGVHLCLGHEYRKLASRNLDLSPEDMDGPAKSRAVRLVMNELARLRSETDPLTAPADKFVAHRQGYRWLAHYEPVRVDPVALNLSPDGVYLVTGGLGGLGLAVTEYIVSHGAKQIALLGRSHLPDRDEWTTWLAEHEPSDRTSDRIRKLMAIEAMGGTVEIHVGNVADPACVTAIIADLVGRHGRVAGVIHSAGVAGGGVIAMKTREAAERVMLPKVRGILALEQAFREIGSTPGFIALFSSLFAVIGGIGQVDYAAANNVLDAYARAHASGAGSRTLAINFGGWREIGMAVNAGLFAPKEAPKIPYPKLLAHPFLFSCEERSLTSANYLSWLRETDHWVLAEHRLQGIATMPGTGLLELVRAAFEDYTGSIRAVFNNIYFFRPLRVPGEELVEVHTTFNALPSGGYGFEVHGRQNGVQAQFLSGDVAAMNEMESRTDLTILAEKCGLETFDFTDGRPQIIQDESGFLNLGPHWQTIRTLWFGTDQLLGELVLPEVLQGEQHGFSLHPSLLDMATGPITGHLLRRLALNLEGEYLPFSYGRLTVNAPLPQRLFSHVRFRGLTGDSLGFDIDLYDENGLHLIGIEEFSLKKVPKEALAAAEADSGYLDEDDSLSTAEGLEIFHRALATECSSQWVISPQPLPAIIDHAKAERIAEEAGADSGKNRVHREDVSIVLPRNRTEEILVGILEGVLGIEPIGTEDNFFDLGIDSLLGLQVVSQAKRFGLILKPAQLFEFQTVSALASAIVPPAQESVPTLLTYGQRELLASESWVGLPVDLSGPFPAFNLTEAVKTLSATYPLIGARVDLGDAPQWKLTEPPPLRYLPENGDPAAIPLRQDEQGVSFRILAVGDEGGSISKIWLLTRPWLGLAAVGLNQIADSLVALLAGHAKGEMAAGWLPTSLEDIAAAANPFDGVREASAFLEILDASRPEESGGPVAATAGVQIEAAELGGLERLTQTLNLGAEELLLAAFVSVATKTLCPSGPAIRVTRSQAKPDNGGVLHYSFPIRIEPGTNPIDTVKQAKAALRTGIGFELLMSGITLIEGWPYSPRLPAFGFVWLGEGSRDGLCASGMLRQGEILGLVGHRSPSGLYLSLATCEQHAAEIDGWAKALANEVRLLLDAGERAEGRGFTAADFSDAELSDEDLDTLLNSVN